MSYRRAVAHGECVITFKPKDASAAIEAWTLFQAVIVRTPLAGRSLKLPSELRGSTRKNVRSAA